MEVEIVLTPPSVIEVELIPAPTVVVEFSVAQGPAGPPAGLTLLNAAEAVGGHRVVCAAIGGVRHVDVSVADDAQRVIGLSMTAASAGGTVTVADSGPVDEPSWSWTPDEPVFVMGLGLLTQSTPTSPAQAFLLRIGVALSPTSIFVSIGEPIAFQE